MWTNNDHQIVILPPGKGFSTPSPASLKASHCSAPMSETKRRSPPANGGDLFHVIHKVPAGDSPYVRAKHVQLIEKDPSRAISLFWSAINAGDRVDSALKDMAIVMKQLNRSDEAIEAIKSFRHLCPHDSQESLDNVLVELYKRAGRIEEEIEMLQSKLKCIEEGVVFGGRRTKTARSQGKKVHITIEEEKSRILGNLAWAYLQLSNYEIAEQYYRRALVFETDRNKECNLAICLMHMNRIAEAKSLLQDVKASSGWNLMDESYSKSFERACEILNNIEAESRLKHGFKDGNSCREPRSSPSPMVAAIRREGGQRDDVYRDMSQPREPGLKDGNSYREPRSSPSPMVATLRREGGQKDDIYRDMRQPRELGLKDGNSYREPRSSPSPMVEAIAREGGQKVDGYMRQPREFCCVNHFQTIDKPKENLTVLGEISSPCVSYGQGNSLRYSQQGVMVNEIRNSYFDENSGERMSGMNNYRAGMNGSEPQAGSWYRKTYYSPVPAWSKVRTPFTQPRRCLWGFGDRRQRKVENSNNTEQKFSCDGDWRKRNSWENGDLKKSTPEEPNLNQGQLATESQNGESTTETPKPTIDTSTKKSWADMAEEEDDEEFFTSCEKFEFYDDWNTEQVFNDENLNCNIVQESPYLQTQMKNVARKHDPFDTRNECFSSGTHSASPKSQPVKRTLFFDHHQKRGNSTDHNNFCALPGPRKSLNCNSLNSAQAKGNGSFPGKNVRLLRRNRLKVFEDITRSP